MDVELRPVTDADVEVFYAQQLDPEARRVAVFPLRDHDTFTTHWRERVLANEANYAWTIVADGEVAGNMLCFERDGKREVGYWLGRAYWGRGIATAALAALLREVTERPLYAYVARSNVASILLDAATYHAIAANYPDAEHHHLELKGKAAPLETFAIRVR
jgi:RimJ/RimL family protein N-acetyltransferase